MENNTKEARLDLGDIRITWLEGGRNALDGGTMYGAVPKILWGPKNPTDEENYLSMMNSPLLVQTQDHNVLIDTGLGNKLTPKQQKIYRLSQPWQVIESLEQHGLRREDIDTVILTHGDYDHASGVTMYAQESGEVDLSSVQLTFPRARHILQRTEWEDISMPNIRSAHTYWEQNFLGLKESGLLNLVDGEADIVPGIRVRHTGGHTRGHQMVEIQGSRDCAVHLGDIFPLRTHTNPLWIMAYDNFPLEVIAQKQRIFAEYRAKNAWFTLYHDIVLRACRVDEAGNITETIPV